MRREAAALALLAALTVLLQPVCAAYELRPAAPRAPAATLADDAAHGTHGRASCCPEVEPSSLVTPSSAGIAKAILAAQAPGPLAYAAAPRAALLLHARPAPGVPPPFPLPYHARSARIQR